MEEKRHKATPKRLRDARKRGEVAISRDVTESLSFVFAVIALWLLGRTFLDQLQEVWWSATSPSVLREPQTRLTEQILHLGQVLLQQIGIVSVIAGLGGVCGAVGQVGALIAFERIKPNFNHLNPGEGLKRIFSTRSLINLVKMVVKTCLLGGLIYAVIYSFIPTAVKLGHTDPGSILFVSGHILLLIFAWAAVIVLLMSVFDYVHERFEFLKNQRMSIEDLRREYRDVEGDPINRSRRRGLHIELLFRSLADRVRGASAVIHSERVAVAVQYLGERDLPRVVARGENEQAQQIRAAAAAALVPTQADAALANRLYEAVPIDQPIPRSLFEEVAALLKWARGNS